MLAPRSKLSSSQEVTSGVSAALSVERNPEEKSDSDDSTYFCCCIQSDSSKPLLSKPLTQKEFMQVMLNNGFILPAEEVGISSKASVLQAAPFYLKKAIIIAGVAVAFSIIRDWTWGAESQTNSGYDLRGTDNPNTQMYSQWLWSTAAMTGFSCVKNVALYGKHRFYLYKGWETQFNLKSLLYNGKNFM